MWGITLVVVVVNVLLFEALTGRRGASVRRAGLGVAALTLILAPFAVPFSEPTGDPLDVAVVQVDVRPPPNTSAVQEDLLVARKNIALDRTLVGSTPRPDLVLWGEGSLDPAASGDPATMVAVQRAIADVGVPTAVGAVMDDPGGLQRDVRGHLRRAFRSIGEHDRDLHDAQARPGAGVVDLHLEGVPVGPERVQVQDLERRPAELHF